MSKQLTHIDRDLLAILKAEGLTQEKIAQQIGCNQSTISRELKRNSISKNRYIPSNSHYWTKIRQSSWKKLQDKWFDNEELLNYVLEKLNLYWSPQQISKTIRLDFPDKHWMSISHEAIYQYVWRDKKRGGSLSKYLRHSKKKRKKRYGSKNSRGIIPNRKSIHDRPEIVERRGRVGDWESDLIVGKNHKGAIATYVDRKTKLLIAMKMESQSAEEMFLKTKQAFKRIPKKFRCTMTHDNGKEIARHQEISKALKIDIFMADPYCSWQRGLNENTNGLIRQFFPKKTDFTKITQDQIDKVVSLINNRPRKSLNYRTPLQVFNYYKYAFLS